MSCWPQESIRQHAGSYANQAANQIAPQETETQNQPTQRRVSDAIDPGRVIQLADLDREGQNQRDDASLKKRTTNKDKAYDQKQHQRPQNIAAGFTDETLLKLY